MRTLRLYPWSESLKSLNRDVISLVWIIEKYSGSNVEETAESHLTTWVPKSGHKAKTKFRQYESWKSLKELSWQRKIFTLILNKPNINSFASSSGLDHAFYIWAQMKKLTNREGPCHTKNMLLRLTLGWPSEIWLTLRMAERNRDTGISGPRTRVFISYWFWDTGFLRGMANETMRQMEFFLTEVGRFLCFCQVYLNSIMLSLRAI